MKRFLFGLFGGLLIAVVAIGALAPLLLQTPLADRLMKKEEELIEVKLEPAELGSLTRTINAPGEIEPETNVEISAQVSARVVDLPFDEGDTVKRNDVVVRLDDRDLQAALDAAEAQVVADRARLLGAEAEVDEAQAALKRQESLYETSDTSLANLEAADARVRRAQSTIGQINAAIDISQARIRQAERDLDNTTIRSPIDGVMTRRQAEVGELVVVGTLNNPGSVILEIADLSRMLVKARIDESNVSLAEVGQQTTIYLNAYPDVQFSGQVKFVGLARQLWRDGSGYVEAEILLLNEDVSRLQTGLTSNVDIEVSTLRNVVKVPSQAIVDRRIEDLPSEVIDNSDLIDTSRTFTRVVYVMDSEGVARARPVQVGSSDLTHTVILAGIDAEERIISGPFKVLSNLKDGTKVKEQGASDKPADEPTEPDAAPAESSETTETAGGGG